MNLIVLATLSLIFVLGWYGWSVGGGRLKQTWPYESDLIAISPNGKLLATPAGPSQKRTIGNLNLTSWSTIKLHSFPDGEVVRTLDAFYVASLAFSPDGSLIAAGTGFEEIFIWRTDDGQLLHSLKATRSGPGREFDVNPLIFSRDGQTLVAGVGDRVDVWRVADGQLLYSLSDKHYRCDISPDGAILALSSVGRERITFYRLSDGTRLRELESYGGPKFSPDGQLLAIYHLGGYEENRWQKVVLYQLEDDTLLGPLMVDFDGQLTDYGFSPDGRYLVATYRTGGYRGSVLIYPDSVTPERWHLVLWRLDDLSAESFQPSVVESEEKRFTAVAFSPDGKFLVTGGDAIRLWRLPS